MAATKIMIIRHAERPPDDGSANGVTLAGAQAPEELIVRGWQRAGALVRLFAPAGGHFADPHLATPDTIFASKVAHTIAPVFGRSTPSNRSLISYISRWC
jgi:hypothetical protein